MRAFEFHEGELVGCPVGQRTIVNLDLLVTLLEFTHQGGAWRVIFPGDVSFELTKPAFDRILLAWKSN